jgi:ribonuclease P protein component
MAAAMTIAGLKRRERISGDARFERIRREGARAGDDFLFVRALANDLGRARLGLAVGRQSGGAVRRSRLRRMIREAFRLNKARMPAGFDLLVAPRAGAAGARLEALGRSLVELAARAAGRTRGDIEGS